ncbi:MAG: hypothetical protein LBD36_02795 [Holosporales bacterium]|nr:hypothetical protein [Holosporales bacterium]
MIWRADTEQNFVGLQPYDSSHSLWDSGFCNCSPSGMTPETRSRRHAAGGGLMPSRQDTFVH